MHCCCVRCRFRGEIGWSASATSAPQHVQRQRELGIRRALGAEAVALLRSVGGRPVLQVVLGLVLGVLLAPPWMAALQSPLQRSVEGHGLLMACAMLLVLPGAVMAAWWPTRQPALTVPMEALRHE